MLAKIACFIAALSVSVSAQFTNPIGSGPVSGLGYMLMNTMPLPPIGNYSIGYLPAIGTATGGAGGVTDMPACRRIQMFKFPALLSGIATMVTMNTLPSASPEVCDVGFNLYTFPGSQQVGTTYIGAVSSMGSTTSGSPGNGPPVYEVSSTLNVSSAGWYITNGTLYYLTIQPFTYNSVGGACNIRLPYGMDTTRPPRYAVVTQQGPIGQPCGVSPWTTVGAIDGGYIHMSIAGVPFTSASPSQTAYLRGSVTASPTPTSVGMKTSASPTGTVTPTGTTTPTSGGINPSGSDTPTGTDSPSVSSSQTPTPSSSSSPSASASSAVTPTVTPTQTSTWTQSQGMSISNTPTSAPMPVASASVSSSGKNLSVPIDTPLAAAAAATGASAPVGSIVGGVFAAIVVVAVIGSVVAFNLSRTVRTQVGKYTGIKDARSPVTSSQSVIVMNPAGNAVSVYHNTM